VKWTNIPFPAGPTVFTFTVASLAFMRPLSGGRPVAGQSPDPSSFADGFYLYVGANYKSDAAFSITGRQYLLSLCNTGALTSIALLKLKATDGTPDWVSSWGTCSGTDQAVLKTLATDWTTGAVYMGGQATSATLGTTSGADHFSFSAARKNAPGCIVSPVTGDLSGISYCWFVPHDTTNAAGFIAKVTDAMLNSAEQVISAKPSDDTTSKPSVVWVKTLGQASAGISSVVQLDAENGLVALGYYSSATAFNYPNLPGSMTGSAATVSRLDD